MVELNVGVARSLASRYAGRGISQDDLEQAACAALVRAARDFDPDRAEDFLSYAVPTMRGEIKKHFRDCGWTVRPPRRIQELQSQVSQAHSRLEQTLGREPTPHEIAEDLHETVGAVDEALAAEGCFTPSSLDRPISEDGDATLGDVLPDGGSDFVAAEARLLLTPFLHRLRPRDKLILRMRFWEGLTQREIGDQIGVTQMQVSRLLNRILEELRAQIGDQLTASA